MIVPKLVQGKLYSMKAKPLICLLTITICNYSCKIKKDRISNTGKESAVFLEGFEAPSINDVLVNWGDRKNEQGMSFSQDVPKGSKGKQSLMMTYHAGKDEGGHLFKQLPQGYDSLFVRFYVKFLTRNSNIHHLVKLGGYNPSTDYPKGLAGLKPNGDDFFISGIEAPDPKLWAWGLYTYWMDMHGDPDGKYWGNVFFPERAEKIPLKEWISVEFMIKMNQPLGASNGEQAFWINGKKILHLGKDRSKLIRKGGHNKESVKGETFEGFQWRNDEDLKLNFFWLNYYMTKGIEGETDKILFDDIVIATSYIGQLH